MRKPLSIAPAVVLAVLAGLLVAPLSAHAAGPRMDRLEHRTIDGGRRRVLPPEPRPRPQGGDHRGQASSALGMRPGVVLERAGVREQNRGSHRGQR